MVWQTIVAAWAVTGVLGNAITAPGSLKIEFDVVRELSPNRDVDFERRDGIEGAVLMELTNRQTYYTCDLYIGSNMQKNTVQIDTGSSDLWVMDPDVICQEAVPEHGIFADIYTATDVPGANPCTILGSFETANLDLFKANTSAGEFLAPYVIGSALGVWGHDMVLLNNFTVLNMSFGVVNETDLTFGTLGIGLTGLELSFTPYENFPVRLVRSGIIHKNVYSLFLNNESALTGSVLFGAVDHAKYSGTLQTVPIINAYPSLFDNPSMFTVVLDSISLEVTSSNYTATNVHYPVVLDAGSTLTYLPSEILDHFMSELSATYSSKAKAYKVNCEYNTDTVHAIFMFSGVKINIPLSELIVQYHSECYFSILKLGEIPTATLGDNFLRHAYVVYDLEDYEISLAQAVYTDEEDIEVVTLTVPLAVKAAGYSATSIQSDTSDSRTPSSSSSSKPKHNDAQKCRVSVTAIFGLVGLTAFALMQ